jgi:hypothetical protein
MSNPTNLRERHQQRIDSHEEIRIREIEIDEAMGFVMGTPAGRKLMWWLLDDAGIYKSTFTGNSTTFYNEGMRNMGLKILHRINDICPDQYPVMVKEAKRKNHGAT